jgi:hypothetical protein
VGVIYADASGTSRAQRVYYYNKQTNVIADLTTEATLQPSQWGTVQLPMGNNLLKDSSFEKGFTTTSDLGWFKTQESNGASANMTTASPHSGMQSLALQQVKPVVYPDAAVAGADYHAFIVSGNNGSGGGVAMVEQRVPVVAGHQYAFRFNYRADGLQANKPTPGAGRGYSSITVLIEWSGAGIAATQRLTGAFDSQANPADWKQETNSSARYPPVPQPYLAPAGATAATVRFRLGTNAGNDLPTVFVDDVELVDVTTGP